MLLRENKLSGQWFNKQFYHEHILMFHLKWNRLRLRLHATFYRTPQWYVQLTYMSDSIFFDLFLLWSNFSDENVYRHKNTGVLQMVSPWLWCQSLKQLVQQQQEFCKHGASFLPWVGNPFGFCFGKCALQPTSIFLQVFVVSKERNWVVLTR
jgi:hypothetical protein